MPWKGGEKGISAHAEGDVYQTYADVSGLMKDFGFKPDTSVEDGLARFAGWFLDYYGNKKQPEKNL